ncbi:hypothetical protein ACQFX9_29755 [Aliinostoc sp. HNIBRCY26]|uniref:hypothetical protein n=1 Tax=Aliinostoc sp. HNIBRCY26 TaxID=3418997 RepID=UPI003CFE7468
MLVIQDNSLQVKVAILTETGEGQINPMLLIFWLINGMIYVSRKDAKAQKIGSLLG